MNDKREKLEGWTPEEASFVRGPRFALDRSVWSWSLFAKRLGLLVLAWAVVAGLIGLVMAIVEVLN
jgi:hypothetical protein